MAMAVSSGGGGGGRRRGRRRGGGSKPMSEINVTPMVDVMLVLLIMFMVAAPLMTSGVPIELPQTQAQAAQHRAEPDHHFGHRYRRDLSRRAAGGARPTSSAQVTPRSPSTARRTASMCAATSLRTMGAVMQVMGALSGAGYAKIGLITEQACSQGQ
jgi:biopolymer transport protein TolR